MDFGPNANSCPDKRKATYFMAPNFTTGPPPEGPLRLGTLVTDLEHFRPINEGEGPEYHVNIPPGLLHAHMIESTRTDSRSTSYGKAAFSIRFPPGEMGAGTSVQGYKMSRDEYKFQRLETVYFHPPPNYIQQCGELPDVRAYFRNLHFYGAAYLITGLKIARGAVICKEHVRNIEGNVECSAGTSGGPLGIEAKAQVGAGLGSGLTSTFGKSADFVLAIQVLKVRHALGPKLLGGDAKLKTNSKAKPVTKGARLLTAGDETTEEDICIECELDEEDMKHPIFNADVMLGGGVV